MRDIIIESCLEKINEAIFQNIKEEIEFGACQLQVKGMDLASQTNGLIQAYNILLIMMKETKNGK